MNRRVLLAACMLLVASTATACDAGNVAAPRCAATQRVALVAQSVPSAAYVPCVATLPPGWSVTAFDAHDGGTDLSLHSDRAARSVRVSLRASCRIGRATPVTPRDEAVRTYASVQSISPDYAGRLYDLFPGGCITYDFRFRRGPHIALIDEFEHAIALMSRRELRERVRADVGVDLDHS